MRDVLKWTIIGGLFLLLFIPLFNPESLFFLYITGKNFAFRIIVEIMFAAWILLALYDKEYRPRFSWTFVSLAAFVAIIFLADMFGVNPAKSLWSNFERMEGWVMLVHLLMYFVVAGCVLNTEKWWTRFFTVSVIACSLVSLVAFFQLAGKLDIAQGGVRIEAWLGNAIYLAIYMLFHVFIALFLLVKSKGWGLRVLYGILALVFSFLLLKTQTRGVVAGLFVGLFVTTSYIAVFAKDNPRLRKLAVIGVTILFILSGTLYAARDTAFVQNSPTLSRIASIFSLKAALKTRSTLWSVALEGVKERPLLGWGQNNFDYVFDSHYKPSLYAQEAWFDRVHNIVLDWLVAGGILGFLAYAAVWLALFCGLFGTSRELLAVQSSRAKWRKKEPIFERHFSVLERAVLMGLLVGYGLGNIVEFDNLISYFFFATILAFVHSRVSKEIPRLTAFHLYTKRIAQIAVPGVAVALCFSLYYVNIPNIRAAKDLIDAGESISIAFRSKTLTTAAYTAFLMQGIDEFKSALAQHSFADQEIREQIGLFAERVYADPRASATTKKAYLDLAESELLNQTEKDPTSARMHAFLGTFYRTIGKSEKALEQLMIVGKLSPQKLTTLFDIGGVYIERKEYEKAKEVFAEAFLLAPEYDEARVRYIAAAIYTHDDALVAELSAPPRQSLYQDHGLILQAYYEIKDYPMVLTILYARIAKNPHDVQLRVSKAVIQHESGDTTAAIETITQAIKDFPEFRANGEKILEELRKEQI